MSANIEPDHAAGEGRTGLRPGGYFRQDDSSRRRWRGGRALWIAGLCGAFFWAGTSRAETVTVFAAASLKTALDEVAGQWRTAEHRVALSYAGSSALARQIELGAPADIFISANPEWMDHLGGRGLIDPDRRLDLLGNRLVLIAHGEGEPEKIGPDLPLSGMLGEGRLAMALVNAVPAGQYGKAALQALGLWESVAERVAQADNVRAALALVALGEAPLGIVYLTDAQAEPRVSVVGVFPPESHPPIVYPAAVIRGRGSGAVLDLFAYLGGDEARATFARHGFLTPER